MILLNVLKKLGSIYNKIEEVTLATMLAGSLMILFINVVLRKFFNSSIYGADELARVLFIWMSWLGISIGERRSEHIRIDMLVQKLHGVPKRQSNWSQTSSLCAFWPFWSITVSASSRSI